MTWTLLFIAPIVAADSITINGRTYEDVLVYQTPRSFYVCDPAQGLAIRVSSEDVDASTVNIVEDAVYRSELQAKYVKAKAERDGGGATRSRAAVRPPGSATVIEGESNGGRPAGQGSARAPQAAASEAGTAMATGGLGISLAQLQGGVRGAGMQFGEAGPGQWTASAPQGNFTVNAVGQEENLTGIQVSASGSLQELEGLMKGMDQSLSTAVPWITEWLPEAVPVLMGGQPAVAERDGVRVKIQAAPADGGFAIQANVSAV